MTAPTLKLVPDTSHVESEIAELAAEHSAARMALIRKGSEIVVPPPGSPRYDDLANSERFLSDIGSALMYCVEQKSWYTWSGTHWEQDREDLVFEFAEMFAKGLYDTADDKEAFKNAQRANNRSGFNAFLELAQRKKAASIESFDDRIQTGRLLNCRNGTLDLESGRLDPHDKSQRITRVVNCDYIADARSDLFDNFLKRVQPDPAIRAFLQRSVGYSLLGEARERSFWILYGGGNNGKSVFTNLINNVLDAYASITPASSIMAKPGTSIPNDIARLKGKRFIAVPETDENERMNSPVIKALSAGDKVSARYLFGEFFDFYFTGKLWIATNHKPTVTDPSDGFWQRVKLVPFSVDIPANEVDRDLLRKLTAEAPAVLAWAVQGARDYFEADGLDTPPVIQAEIDAYRHEQDSIAQFLEERCQTWAAACELRERNPSIYINETEFQISNSELYKAYEKFCKENGEYQRSHRRLSQNMKERGFAQGNSGGRYWEGIRLTGGTE